MKLADELMLMRNKFYFHQTEAVPEQKSNLLFEKSGDLVKH